MTPSDNLLTYVKTSPYFAQIDQENPERRDRFLEDFEKLPENIREFFLSEETAHNITDIAHQYSLNDDQAEFLARTVREAVMRTITPQQIPDFIMKKFTIDQIRATEISRALAQQVLSVLNQPSTPQPIQPQQGPENGNTLDLRK